jgi:hypothetical protein
LDKSGILGSKFSFNFVHQHQSIKMKNPVRSLALGIALLGAVTAITTAATVSFSDSNNATTDGVNFTFSQFDPSLGTLTAVDLIIQSSTLQGDMTFTRTGLAARTYSDVFAELAIDVQSGFAGYVTSPLSFARTPSGSFTVDGTNTSQLITVTGTTQSLIGGTPITFGINSAFFGAYTGFGTMSFASFLLVGDDNNGSGTININTSNLLSPTTLTLRYTYTNGPVPIPEPGQVAASLLLLGGIGAYVFLKRRKKPATTAV